MFRQLTFRRYISASTFSTLLLAVFLLQTTSSKAQPELFDLGIYEANPNPEDAQGRAIHQTRDGGFACIAKWYEEEGAQFTKLDMFGNVQEHMYYFEDPGLDPWSIHQNNPNDAGYVFVGANTRIRRMVLVKINDAGLLTWYKRMGTPGESEARCVEVLNDDNYAMVGFEHDPVNPNLTHLLMVCFDPSEAIVWSARFNVAGYLNCQIADMRGFSIRQVGTQSIVVVGSVDFDCSPNLPQQGAVLLEFSIAGGSLSFTKGCLYQTPDYALAGMDVRKTCDRGYLITGIAESLLNPGDSDGFAIRTDDSGNIKWSQIVGNVNNVEELYAGEASPDKGAMLVGRSTDAFSGASRILAVRLSEQGNPAWATRAMHPNWPAGSNQAAFDMERTVEGTYAIAGYKDNDGTNIIHPHTYIMHMDDLFCFNEAACQFSPSTDFIYQKNIITKTNLLQTDVVKFPGPDTTFVNYLDYDFDRVENHECSRHEIHPPLFQFHFNDHVDRGYGGVPLVKNLSGTNYPMYALTGVAGNSVNSPSSEMPLVLHYENGGFYSHYFIQFEKSPGVNYGAEGHDVQLTSSDGFVVGGRLINDLGGGSEERNAVLVKADGSSNPLWEISVGQKLANYDELFTEVRPVPTAGATDGNGYVAAGFATNNGSNRQALVTHVNQSGAVQFANTYEVQMRSYTEASSIQPVDSDGDGLADNGFIVAGSTQDAAGNPGNNGFTNRDVFVMRLDNSGNVLWANSYSVGDCWATSIVPTDDDADGANDDGFILCGVVKDGTNFDALVIKLDDVGTVQWRKQYDRSENDRAMSIVQREDGTFAFTGVTYYNDVVNGVNYQEQVYLVLLNTSGGVEKSQAAPAFEAPFTALEAAQEDCANDIDAMSDGSLFITGSLCSFTQGYKGDMYSAKTICDSDCRMQPLNDESVSTPTVDKFLHVIGVCGGATTVCTTDVDNVDWIHTEDAQRSNDDFFEEVICHIGELCAVPVNLATSVHEREAIPGIQVKANPSPVRANSLLVVTTDEDIDKHTMFRIHDLSGRLMLEAPAAVAQPEHLLPIGDWPAGVYILTLQAPDGRGSAIKFVVE